MATTRRYTAEGLSAFRRSAAELLAGSPAVVPMVLAVGVFLALGASEAGFYPVGSARYEGLGWLPAALCLLVLLVMSAGFLGWPRPPRLVIACIAFFAAFTAWSYLSVTWAEQQGTAWASANRTAAYLVLLCLFSLWPVRADAGRLVLGAFGLGVAALGLIELLRADAATDPFAFFIDARFSEPAGYMNANAALWAIGLWPCLWLAARRETPVILRGLALGGAGLLACCALMAQSRGWVLAVPAALIVALLLTPGRLRLALAALAVAAGTLAARGPLLAVHDDYDEARFGDLVSEAVTRSLAVAGVLLVVGVVVAIVDRGVRPDARRERAVSVVAAALAAVALTVGAVAFVVREGSPISKVEDAWEDFKKPSAAGPQAGGSRFTSSGTNRYDFWRVSWDLFEDNPIKGIGAENFQADYFERGRSDEQPRYPHSLELEVLTGTGIIGALLLGASLLTGILGPLRARSRMPPEARAVSAVALTVFAYWALHASIDWFWAFAGLTGPAIAMLGLAMAGEPPAVGEPAAPVGRAPGRRARTAVGIGAALAATAMAVAFLTLWWSEREFARAAETGAANPRVALKRLDRAADLNPLSPRPHLLAAAISIRSEDQARAQGELREVLRLEPRTVYALVMLGALQSERGDFREARELLERAVSHAPRSDLAEEVLRRIRRGRAVSASAVGARYAEQARRRARTND